MAKHPDRKMQFRWMQFGENHSLDVLLTGHMIEDLNDSFKNIKSV